MGAWLDEAFRFGGLVEVNLRPAGVSGAGFLARACALRAAVLGFLAAEFGLGVGRAGDAEAPGAESPAAASAMTLAKTTRRDRDPSRFVA